METEGRGIRVAAIAMIVVAGSVAPVAYRLQIGRVPGVEPEEAAGMLGPGSSAVLVDVRPAEAYAAGHIDGAQSWPYDRIEAASVAEDVPEALRGKDLLLICDGGILSAFAAARLEGIGGVRVWNVRGGMQVWIASAAAGGPTVSSRIRDASGAVHPLPHRDSTPIEEWAAVLSGFLVKPIYTLLSLAIFIALLGRRSPDLAALRWAMLAFFIGENFCAANYLFFNDRSLLFENLHSFGMVVCFGFSTFALLEGMDLRLIKLSDPGARCAALGLCRACIKHGDEKTDGKADVPCALRRLFLFVVPATLAIGFIPFCADPVATSYTTEIFGTPYANIHPIIHQIFETRVCPTLAIAALAISFAILLGKGRDAIFRSKVYFAAGAGALGFALFRLFLFAAFRDDLMWFGFWEEATEFLFIAGAGLALRLFRRGLFASEAR